MSGPMSRSMSRSTLLPAPLGARLSTTVVAGFPGAGKSTLIRGWLASKPAGERWAVLVNGAAPLGIDAGLLPEDAVAQVAGGCACCAARVALGAALTRLLRRGSWDRLLIELSGLGHPGPLVDQLRGGSLAGMLRIDEIVAVVDAGRIETQLRGGNRDLAVAQIEAADRVVLNRSGALPADRTAALEVTLRDWPPFARGVEPSTDGEAGLPNATPASIEPGKAGERGRLARRWPADCCFDRTRLVRVTRDWSSLPGLLRGKAVFRTSREWYCWQFDGQHATWESSGWRRDSRIELIVAGERPVPAEFVARVEAGLLTALRPDDGGSLSY
jgi:hypothetical protein